MSETLVFDAAKFKTTTRAQWENAAEAWHRWGPFLGRWLGPATERMLDLAGVREGSRVLDVAAGAGEQTLRAARRVGPAGRVLATDISPGILEYAGALAREAGLGNVETRELDGEALEMLSPGSFDAVISRVGLIYFPDQQKALAGMMHALAPSGRIGAIVYSTADRNPFFSIPVSIIRRRAALPPPLPGQPGPVLARWRRRARQRLAPRRLSRRGRREDRSAGAARVRGGVRAFRAGIVRRAASNDVHALGIRARRDVGRDRAASSGNSKAATASSARAKCWWGRE